MITENLSTLKIHKLTKEQYERELAAGRIDENALYLTPEEEVDLSGYATVEQLGEKADKTHEHKVSEVTDLQNALDKNLEDANVYADNAVAEIDFPVDSVNGKTGAVALTASDVGAPTVDEMNSAIAAIPTPDVSGQINSHDSNPSAHEYIRGLISDVAGSIPTSLSQLSEDDGNMTVTAAEKDIWNAKSDFSGDYNALTNKPDISVFAKTSDVNQALAKKSDSTHKHDGVYDTKGAAAEVQVNLDAVSESLGTHTDDGDIHVTAAKKTNWDLAYEHRQSAHARTDATKVEDSTTNGNILINGTETNVYTHPSSGVTAKTYKSVTVDAQGHVTAGSNPTTLAGYGITDAESKGAAETALASAKTYTNTVAATKDHNHDSIYDAVGSANQALVDAKVYADQKTSGLASTTSVNTSIKNHNDNKDAHSYIRGLISDLTTRLNTLANSTDEDLDQMAEIVAYIKNNKGLIDAITTSKVSVSDIVDVLTSSDAAKVLSANQGRVLKGLIDALQDAVNGKANATHEHSAADITSGTLPIDRGGTGATTPLGAEYKIMGNMEKATTDVQDSTLMIYKVSEPSASKGVTRYRTAADLWKYIKGKSDAEYATQTGLNTHISDSTHITPDERTRWNAAYTHRNAQHAPVEAEPNQNAFSNITVGSTTIAADTTTDTIEFAGSNVTITPDTENGKVTFTVESGSTSKKGIVKLTNSTSSTSTTTAATPSSVKSAYDAATNASEAAAAAQTKADSAYELAGSKVGSLSDLGITTSAEKLNYMNDVTSPVQAQLANKSDIDHTHNYAASSSAGGAATSANKVNKSLTIKLNSGTTEGTNLFTFNGSAAKSMNITPSAIGASESGHNHNGEYYIKSEIDNKVADLNTAIGGKAASSHTHAISDVSGLQGALDGKLSTSGGTVDGDLKVTGIEELPFYFRKNMGTLDAGTKYASLDSKYKDGTYHRMWRLRWPAGENFWGKVKVTLLGTYSSFNASGVMSKTITCNFNGSSIYNNLGCYDGLGVNVEQDCRISEAIWNSTAGAWEFLIWQTNLSGNNSVGVIIEAWSRSDANLTTAKGITAQPVELTQATSYTASKASSTGGTKTVNWADLPVFETPLGLPVATMDDLATKAPKSSGIFYIVGTGTTTGTWLGSHDDITAYFDGLTIAYKVAIAGVSGTTTLNINNLGAITVVRNASTAISTAFPVNSVVLLTYTTDDGTAYWKVADYDSNTKTTAGTSNKTGTKLYLAGATSQSSSGATTYSNTNCYIGTDNKLYSAGKAVLNTDDAYTHPSTHAASMITGLATVATSGSYNDLSNKPTIPAAYTHPSTHAASMISAGTFGGQVVANATAVATIGTPMVRNIEIHTTDLTAGTSSLATGSIYLVYE